MTLFPNPEDQELDDFSRSEVQKLTDELIKARKECAHWKHAAKVEGRPATESELAVIHAEGRAATLSIFLDDLKDELERAPYSLDRKDILAVINKELARDLEGSKAKMKIVKGFYRHYKGGVYYVLGVGRMHDSKEDIVVYESTRSSEDGIIRLRSASDWDELVNPETGKLDGNGVPRFERVGFDAAFDLREQKAVKDATEELDRLTGNTR